MKQGKFRLCSGTRIPTEHQVRFRCECFFIYYLMVCCSRQIWIVEHCRFYRWICRMNICIYYIKSSQWFRGFIAGIAIVVMVAERRHRVLLCAHQASRENSTNFQDKGFLLNIKKDSELGPNVVAYLLVLCSQQISIFEHCRLFG